MAKVRQFNFSKTEFINETFDQTVESLSNIGKYRFIPSSFYEVPKYQTITITEGDTPETIAQTLYGDPTLSWIVLKYAGIHADQWPKSEQEIRENLSQRYADCFSIVVGDTHSDISQIFPLYAGGIVSDSSGHKVGHVVEINSNSREIIVKSDSTNWTHVSDIQDDWTGGLVKSIRSNQIELYDGIYTYSNGSSQTSTFPSPIDDYYTGLTVVLNKYAVNPLGISSQSSDLVETQTNQIGTYNGTTHFTELVSNTSWTGTIPDDSVSTRYDTAGNEFIYTYSFPQNETNARIWSQPDWISFSITSDYKLEPDPINVPFVFEEISTGSLTVNKTIIKQWMNGSLTSYIPISKQEWEQRRSQGVRTIQVLRQEYIGDLLSYWRWNNK